MQHSGDHILPLAPDGRLIAKPQKGVKPQQLILFLALAGIFLGFIALLGSELRDSYKRDLDFATRDLVTLSRMIERHTAKIIDKADITLNAAAAIRMQEAAVKLGYSGNRKAIEAELHSFLHAAPELEGIWITDENGVIIHKASTVDYLNPSPDVTDRPYFQHHRDNPDAGLLVSEPLSSHFFGKRVIVLSRRIDDLDGRFAGIVLSVISVAYFDSFYKSLDIGKDGVIGLIDDHFQLVVRTPQNGTRTGQDVSIMNTRKNLQISPHQRVFRTFSAIDGKERLYATRELENGPMMIIVGRSWEEIVLEWQQKAMIYALAASFLLFSLAGMFFFWLRGYRNAIVIAKELRLAYDETINRTRALLDSLPDPAWLRDRDGRNIAVNEAFLQLCGKPSIEVIGKTVEDIFPQPLSMNFRLLDDEALLRQKQVRTEGVLQTPSGDTKYFDFIRTPVRDENGEIVGVAGFARNVTLYKEAEARVTYLAEYDSLTGLPNRVLMKKNMSLAIARLLGKKMWMALLLVDLDHFKNINDSLGHTVGDKLLQEVANRLRGILFDKDTISRQGGDEFAVLLVDCANTSTIAIIAQRIIDALNQPFDIDNHEFHLSASIGISVYPDDGDDIDSLLQNADTALYSAKKAGRDCYHFFAPEMNQRVIERVQIERRLRKAVERNELELYYQPQYELRTGRVTGVEALLRWRFRGELIPPDRFIPITEETGLILPIGEWVLREACQQAMRWRKEEGMPPFVIAVNLSTVQFRARDLMSSVMGALENSGLEARWLELEITESALADDMEHVMKTLEELRASGIKVAIDDFGTGYSNLTYLRRFPLDKIKIDRSFIRDIATNTEDAAIVQAIIALASKLGLRVIAEGVETQDQLKILSSYGCNEVQGFYFSHPLPAREIPALSRDPEVSAKAQSIAESKKRNLFRARKKTQGE